MKTTCIIVDDEPLARTAIATLLAHFDGIEIVAECENTFEALKVLQDKRVDLMFLDIQMPEVTGLEFLRSLKDPPAVILTTAYRQYAVEGFELDVLDYLLKPISLDRMMKAVNKYYHLHQPRPQPGVKEERSPEEFINIRADRKNIRLHLDEILWIMSLKDYVQVFTTGDKYITQVPIGEIESQLPESRFLRVHRSYIVNISKVTAFTGQDIEIDQMEIPIGRSYKNFVVNILGRRLHS